MIRQLRSAPNLLTLLRLVFIPFIVIAVVENHYGWALVIFIAAGLSDGLDGLLARLLKQKTLLGQYLDPIADKLLLSTMFLVLAATRRNPALIFATVLVFARDIIILIVCTLLYIIGAMKLFPGANCDRALGLAQPDMEGTLDRDRQDGRHLLHHRTDYHFRRPLSRAPGLRSAQHKQPLG